MADIILKTLTASPTQDLMTVEELKVKLGIPAGNIAGDEALAALITTYSDVIATLCNRVFGRERMQETWRGLDSSNRVFLSHYPIKVETDVESVYCPRGSTVINPVGYEIELKSGKVELYQSQMEPIVITYTGGYKLPEEAPPALKECLAIMVRDARASEQLASVAGVRSLSHKESRVVYFDPNATASRGGGSATGGMGLTGTINALLMHYVRLQV